MVSIMRFLTTSINPSRVCTAFSRFTVFSVFLIFSPYRLFIMMLRTHFPHACVLTISTGETLMNSGGDEIRSLNQILDFETTDDEIN